jgi:hypothetical protein
MELSTTREAASCAATQGFPSILWNARVYYRIQKNGCVLNEQLELYSLPQNVSSRGISVSDKPFCVLCCICRTVSAEQNVWQLLGLYRIMYAT